MAFNNKDEIEALKEQINELKNELFLLRYPVLQVGTRVKLRYVDKSIYSQTGLLYGQRMVEGTIIKANKGDFNYQHSYNVETDNGLCFECITSDDFEVL